MLDLALAFLYPRLLRGATEVVVAHAEGYCAVQEHFRRSQFQRYHERVTYPSGVYQFRLSTDECSRKILLIFFLKVRVVYHIRATIGVGLFILLYAGQSLRMILISSLVQKSAKDSDKVELERHSCVQSLQSIHVFPCVAAA